MTQNGHLAPIFIRPKSPRRNVCGQLSIRLFRAMAVEGRVGYNIAQIRLRRRVPGRRFHQRRRNDPMQLYVTYSSLYARIARVVLILPQ